MKAHRDPVKAFRAGGAVASITAAAGTDGTKLPRFSGNAYTGAPMTPEGWRHPIICDLAGIKIPADQHRPALRQHDHEQLVGHTDGITVDDKGVQVAGVFSGEKHHADKVTTPGKNGFKWQLSIGANPTKTTFLDDGDTATVNGRDVTGPMTIAHETELGEISFVPLGADGDTSASVQASNRRAGKMFKAMLKAAKANGSIRAAKFSDDEIEKMSEDEAKAALSKCMKGDDDDQKTEAEDDDADKVDADDEADVDADDDPDAEADDEPPAKAKAGKKAGVKAKASRYARIKARRKAEADEDRRVDAIRAAGKKHGVTTIKAGGRDVAFAPHAIEQGWSADKAELEALRAARPTGGGPLVYSTSHPDLNDAVIEAAVFQANRLELFEDSFYTTTRGERSAMTPRDAGRIKAELKQRYPERVLDAAHTLFKGRIGLQQMLTTIARAGGYRGRETISDDNLGQVAAACMHQITADGASTLSVANVTANVLNKFMLQGYLFTEQAWKEIAAIRAVKDFKATKSINLFGDVEFQDLGASGELKNATLQDQAFANQVTTSGRILTIPRTTIINDDLGAFGQVPMVMGRGAGLKLNKVFWSKFLNPGTDDGGSTAFWAATHTIPNQKGNSNLSTGAGSALSSAGLNAANLLFDKQVDPMGYPLGVEAEILLYPPDLQTAALELMNSEYIVYGGGSAAKQPANNIWKGRFKPVKSRYLSNPNYTGYSALAWYLLANPSILPVIEMAFLNGQEMPTVQAAGPDFQFNVLGMTTRAFFDIGCNVQNFRGGVQSAGS